MTTSRGITDTRVYDREGVIDRYGIPPELIPDFIGLKGDTSDNIPGVPGIGDKTAAELLQRFGSLEEVLDHIDDISGAKRKQNLTEHADDARISKQLATAKRDIAVELDLQQFVVDRPGPLASSATRSASSSCASRCAGSRRRSARPTPPRPPPSASRRSPRACEASRARGPHPAPADRGRGRGQSSPRRPRVRCSPTDPAVWRFGVYADGRPRCSPARRRAPGGARRGARQPAGDRPRRQVARRGAGRRSPTTPRSAPTCSSRPAAPTRSASCARSAASAPTSADDGRRRRAARPRARQLAARGDPRPRPDRPVRTTSSCRSSGSCARWSWPG